MAGSAFLVYKTSLFKLYLSFTKKYKMNIPDRLNALRKAMSTHRIGAYIIPSNDPHQSEYVPARWMGRSWISGFTGSAGTVVVTLDDAGLWTDSRYFLQAEQELKDTGITLYKMKNQFGSPYIKWIVDHLPDGLAVGIDGNVCSVATYEKMQKVLSPKGISIETQYDLLDEIWYDRPGVPENVIFEHDVKYCGQSRAEKLDILRKKMSQKEVDHHLVTTLDDIAWIFNIRGNDVDFNPVAVAYACISHDGATLYINPQKVPEDLRKVLEQNHIRIMPYEDIIQEMNRLDAKDSILIDPHTCNYRLYRAINAKKVNGMTISRHLKAIKNEVEQKHIRQVMIKDGAALAKAFFRIEKKLDKGEPISEADVADMLAEERAKMPNYIGESFPAIVGFKGNGAIIHYRPYHESCATLKKEGLLLIDSGGQYLDGTTDITRTIALGTPTQEEKRNFTLVLKGHIALAKQAFPQGTAGGLLDLLARMHLWQHRLNYGHGTGHGVGFFLNVHEPPQGFAGLNSTRGTTVHEEGMLTSNEPGYYKEGMYGIRIENLVLTMADKKEGFLAMDTVTLYPIDIRLIDETIFTAGEKAWLNKYHQEVKEKITPLLDGEVRSWFEIKCRGMN